MTSFTLPTRDLLRAIAEVQPFAGRDDTLPMLTGIRFELGDGELVLAATDRYAVGASRIVLDQEENQDAAALATEFVLGPTDLAAIRRCLTGPRGDNPAVRVTTSPVAEPKERGRHVESVTLETTGQLPGLSPAVRLTVNPLDVSFPPWRTLFPPMDALPETAPPTAFNPKLLAKFAKAQRDGEPLVVHSMPRLKPIVVTLGDHFAGMVMPQRLAGDNPAQAWVPAVRARAGVAS